MAKIENDKPSDSSSVGYGKPPTSSRFPPGKSGNPKGRPKGSFNLGTTLQRKLQEFVVINENGKRRQITKLEAAVMQIVNKAASGDLRAFEQMKSLKLSEEERAAKEDVPGGELNELDEKVAIKILKRYEQAAREEDNFE